MNWIDLLIVFLLIMYMLKGYYLGLMLSLFNLLQVIISLVITKNYYYWVYEYMKGSQLIYNAFTRVIYFFFRIIFFRKERLNPGFLDSFMTTNIINVVLLGFSILLIYKISIIIIDVLFSLFSFLLNIKIFKRLDRYGGVLFGFLKGFLSLLIIYGVLGPILGEMPGLMLSDAFMNSKILNIIGSKIYMLDGGLIYSGARRILAKTLDYYRTIGVKV